VNVRTEVLSHNGANMTFSCRNRLNERTLAEDETRGRSRAERPCWHQ